VYSQSEGGFSFPFDIWVIAVIRFLSPSPFFDRTSYPNPPLLPMSSLALIAIPAPGDYTGVPPPPMDYGNFRAFFFPLYCKLSTEEKHKLNASPPSLRPSYV